MSHRNPSLYRRLLTAATADARQHAQRATDLAHENAHLHDYVHHLRTQVLDGRQQSALKDAQIVALREQLRALRAEMATRVRADELTTKELKLTGKAA